MFEFSKLHKVIQIKKGRNDFRYIKSLFVTYESLSKIKKYIDMLKDLI